MTWSAECWESQSLAQLPLSPAPLHVSFVFTHTRLHLAPRVCACSWGGAYCGRTGTGDEKEAICSQGES